MEGCHAVFTFWKKSVFDFKTEYIFWLPNHDVPKISIITWKESSYTTDEVEITNSF